MCKASSEPGGPQRCSGDTRAKAARSVSEVTALETQERDLTTRLNGTAGSAPTTPAWGPHIGPPPFANPPNAPDFDQWYAEKLAQVPDYSREHAYGHFYNLAGDVSGMPGYTAHTAEQLQQAAPAEEVGAANMPPQQRRTYIDPSSGESTGVERHSMDQRPAPTERLRDFYAPAWDADGRIGTDDPNSPFWGPVHQADVRKAAKALSEAGQDPKKDSRVGRAIDKLTRKNS